MAGANQNAGARHNDSKRRLVVVLHADVAGYSRLMEADEAGTHARLIAARQLIDSELEQHGGRLIGTAGDAVLATFESVTEGLRAAIGMQRAVAERHARLPADEQLFFRIGMNLGDVIIDGDDVFGNGVNVAARIEALADPGGIAVSAAVREQVGRKLNVVFEDRGTHRLKNITDPIRVFAVRGSANSRAKRRPRLGTILILASASVVCLLAGLTIFTFLGPALLPDEQRSIMPDAERMKRSAAIAGKPSIAVLPFDNLGADPEEEYFVDGLTDDLITDLSKVSGLFVIARNSAFTYKDQPVDIPEVAGQLGVRYVLKGSVRRAGDRVRINAQLIDGSTGRNIWADRYDRDYAEIFTLQDEVIARIVEALEVELSETEQILVARLPTDSLEAYDYYLRAEELIYRSDPASAADALDLYEKAFSLDPTFADAHAGYARVAADVLVYDYRDALPAAVARKRAYEAAGRALTLDPQLSRGYSVLALLQMLDGEHRQAIASAGQAVHFSPNSAEAHLNLAVVLTYAGQHEELLRTIDTVLRLNPKPPPYVHDYRSLVLYMNHRYADAVEALGTGEDAARSDLALETLSAANAQLSRLDEAEAAVEQLLERWPDQSIALYRVMYAHYAREEDLIHRLEGLRLAGLPEWPYGFHGDSATQLRGEEIDAVTFGRTWVGELASGGIGPFMQYTDSKGAFVQRGANHQLTGTAWRSGDELCLEAPSLLLGRRYCGPVFRNADGTSESRDEYSFVSASGISRFAVQP